MDEAMLTGEATPVTKRAGTALRGGTMVVNGFCEAEVTALCVDSVVRQLVGRQQKTMKHFKEKGGRKNNVHMYCVIFVVPVRVGKSLVLDSHAHAQT